MTLLEKIIHELNSATEPLLRQVLDLIQSQQRTESLTPSLSEQPRIAGLHEGQVWISDDFNEPLPDDFWLGEDA
jgi:hypothetical protein